MQRSRVQTRATSDRFTPEKRSEIMRQVKSNDTSPELSVRKLLHSQGFRFRLHKKDLPGKPDIVRCMWTGVGSGASGILGAAAAGLLGDRVKNRLWLAAGASLAAAGPVYAAIRMPAGSAAGAVWLAMTGYGLLQMYYGLVYAAIQDVAGPEMRGRAMATY